MRELLATVGADELAEWEAFYQVEPWGETREDYQTALLASILANQFRTKGSPAKVKDFVPDFWRDDSPKDNLTKMIAVCKAFAAATQTEKKADTRRLLLSPMA